MNICTRCNQPLPENALVCPYCGTPITAAQPQQPAYTAQPAQPQQPAYTAQPVQPTYAAQPAYTAQPQQPAYDAQPAYTAAPTQPAYDTQATYTAQPTYVQPEEEGPAFASQCKPAKVLGILSIVFFWFPFVNYGLLIPATILTVIGMVKSRVKKGLPVTCIVLCGIALLLSSIVMGVLAGIGQAAEDILNDDTYYEDYYDFDDYDYYDYSF